MRIALVEHIMITIIVKIVKKNVLYAQKKVLIKIYVYHAIIEIIIINNMTIHKIVILHLWNV